MASEPDLRREIADERRELTNAVADLRKELDKTAERGKRIGVMVGAVAGDTAGRPDGAAHPPPLPATRARRTASKRVASVSTIEARTGATSSSVSVPSREPKASRNASDRFPSPIVSGFRYSSKTSSSRSSSPAASRIAARTSAAGTSSSTTKARSWRTSGYGLTSSKATTCGAASASVSRSSSNAPQTPSSNAGWSSPSQPSVVLAAFPGCSCGWLVRSYAGSTPSAE